MEYEEFISRVAQRWGEPESRAADITRATLLTLAERLTGGEAADLAAQLPAELKAWLPPHDAGTAERFDVEEFKRRVGRRAALPPDDAEAGIRAVFAVLREAVTPGEFDDVLSQLPKEFRQQLVAA